MKLHEFILISSIFALVLLVGFHAYEIISTGTLVVLGTLSIVFGASSALKVFNIK